MVVSPSGGALWRIGCRFDAKERLLWFGAKSETRLAHPRALAVRGNRHPASSPSDGSRHGSRRASCGAICNNGRAMTANGRPEFNRFAFPGLPETYGAAWGREKLKAAFLI